MADDCRELSKAAEEKFRHTFDNLDQAITNQERWQALDSIEEFIEFVDDNYERYCG